MLQDLLKTVLMSAVRVIAHLLLSPLIFLDFVTNMPMSLLHKILCLLTLHGKDWLELITVVIAIASIRVLYSYQAEIYRLKEINAKLAIDHEFNIARKTIRCMYFQAISDDLLTRHSQSPSLGYLW